MQWSDLSNKSIAHTLHTKRWEKQSSWDYSILDIFTDVKNLHCSYNKGSTDGSYSWKEASAITSSLFETMSLPTRTKERTFIKGVLNCCKLQVIFKS